MENAICNCLTSKREPHWCPVHGAMRETPTRTDVTTAPRTCSTCTLQHGCLATHTCQELLRG